ncbi:pescadillo homolog [Hylaeus volcanicus]|uniref:pescadillo homolog n=1 Tax=Hylaeus volcanicus TaxID=313075 RepID=UPI0023B77F7C|nr:pescadillo homolog [Hylaeus volcanicus]
MGLKTKKGTKGCASKYLTRAAALRKLQLSLAAFRRLCILKGIYPREPKRKLHGRDKTYYHTKDILHLYHEPVLEKLRLQQSFEKKYKRAISRHEKAVARSLEKQRPFYTLFHIVKERYNTLVDAVRDLDDALSTVALFACLPSDDSAGISSSIISASTQLFDEFIFFCAKKKLVRRVFCSIKGFYIQVKVLGQSVIFLIPHQFTQDITQQVDYKVLLTFLEFYLCMLKSVNFKLYSMESWAYPPKCHAKLLRAGYRFLSLSLNEVKAILPFSSKEKHSLDTKSQGNSLECDETHTALFNKHVEDLTEEEEEERETEVNLDEFEGDPTVERLKEESEEDKVIQSLFSGLSFFISREVPRVVLAFLLESCGAEIITWEDTLLEADPNDTRITHHILDRPMNDALKQYSNTREFVQPQWVFDSINARKVLPIKPYGPGLQPPAHLSPFVENSQESFAPQQRSTLETRPLYDDEFDEAQEDHHESDVDYIEDHEKYRQQDVSVELQKGEEPKTLVPPKKRKRSEERNLAEKERKKSLLSKKHKRLLDRIEFGKERKATKRRELEEKRRKLEENRCVSKKYSV